MQRIGGPYNLLAALGFVTSFWQALWYQFFGVLF
jgi:hypothetical protein